MISNVNSTSIIIIMLIILFLHKITNLKEDRAIQCELSTDGKFRSCDYLFSEYLSSIDKTLGKDEPIGYNVILKCNNILDIKIGGEIVYDVKVLDDSLEILFPQSFWGFKTDDSSFVIYECQEFWGRVCDPFYDLYKVTVTKKGRLVVEKLIDIDHVRYCKSKLKRSIINRLKVYNDSIEFSDVYAYLHYSDSICDISDTMCKYDFDTDVYLYSFWQSVEVCDSGVFDSIYYTLKSRYNKIWDGIYAAYIDNLHLKYKLYCND